jgi:pyruvyltransferase
MAIGSILWMANARTEVWGSGYIGEGMVVQERPRAIHAVRGPLTREALIKAGIDCPEVYGDPALLLPRFFDPEVPKKYEVGIIPHYVDKGHRWVERHRTTSGILIIDVTGDLWEFVRAVKSCKAILSSSLHGLICADAYGVANAWIQLSDQVFGGGFKFRDYRLSIGAEEPKPIEVHETTLLAEIVAQAESHQLDIDLRKLLLACPFLSEQLHARLQSLPPGSCGLPHTLVEVDRFAPVPASRHMPFGLQHCAWDTASRPTSGI